MPRPKKIQLIVGEPRVIMKDGRKELKYPIPKCGKCKRLTVASVANYKVNGKRFTVETARYCVSCKYSWPKRAITQHVY